MPVLVTGEDPAPTLEGFSGASNLRWQLGLLLLAIATILALGGNSNENRGDSALLGGAPSSSPILRPLALRHALDGGTYGLDRLVVARVDTGDNGDSVVQPEADEPTPGPVTPGNEIEALICSYPWPCGEALNVSRCEAGPDYIAGFNASGHAGSFQISPLHAWRFAQWGWDFWVDALVVARNVAVAFEIWLEQGWRPWSCKP